MQSGNASRLAALTVVLALFGAAACGSSGSGDTEPPDMVGMTAAHNAARAAVMPAASPPIPTMTWSETVAASAQAFVESCKFADTGPPYGSNAFAGTGTYTPAQVVTSWVNEDANYDYGTNSCSSVCGHYTQVVWRDSTELGCGMANCTDNNPFGSSGPWQLWVCNYNPPGNYVGMKPY
jgi:pathogenesis-related protein 1